MCGQLYHLGKQQAVARAEELLERFSLTEAARRPIKTYSGGIKIAMITIMYITEVINGFSLGNDPAVAPNCVS